jgi:hypothetical protein
MVPSRKEFEKHFSNAHYIASVLVYVDKKEQHASSSSYARSGGESFIMLRPNGIDHIDSYDKAMDVLAHELGHWIAYQDDSKNHSSAINLLATLTGDGRLRIPAEREAWEWAKKMRPNLNKEDMKAALATYGDTSYHARMI